MKYLKYLLYAIIGLVVIFFAFGLFMSEVSYGSEIVVDKPVEEAWDVANDEALYPQWLKGFKSMELVSGKRGEKGSQYKIIVQPEEGGEAVEMIETVEDIKENELVQMHFESKDMDFHQIMEFSENEGKTTITTKSKVMAKSILWKSFFASMQTLGGVFTMQEQENMDGLKKLINENTRDYDAENVAKAINLDPLVKSLELLKSEQENVNSQ